MVTREIEVVPKGDLVVGQQTLREAGLTGRLRLIVQKGEIRVVSEAEIETGFDSFPADEQLIQIDREQQAYETQHSQILEEYAGQYIAMRHGKVVDHDEDSVELWHRVHKNYGKEPVLITPVLDEPRQVITVRSPRLLENIR